MLYPWTEKDNITLVHQVQNLGKRPANVKVGRHTKNSIVGQIRKLRLQGIVTRKFVKRTKSPEDFMLSEVRFIREHTINAINGERMSAAQLAALPEMKRHTKE